jgi:hypothetical protein
LKEAALTARTGGARPEDRYLAFRRRAIDLLDDGRIVAAEIYPAEIYSHVGLSRTFGKTSRQGRRGEANSILSWCARNAAAVPVDLAVQIEDGFGDDDAGEDRFDSFIGALGMMEAVAGLAGSTVPDDPAVRNVEGWIPGMRISPYALRSSRCAHEPLNSRPNIHPGPIVEKLVDPSYGDGIARVGPASWAPRQASESGSTEIATPGKSSRAANRSGASAGQEVERYLPIRQTFRPLAGRLGPMRNPDTGQRPRCGPNRKP